jgi:hypothetical protein
MGRLSGCHAWTVATLFCVAQPLVVSAQSVQLSAPRRALAGSWAPVPGFAAEHAAELLHPGCIAASAGIVLVCDLGDLSVKAFSAEGRLLWRFGRRGQGPGEFLNFTDLKPAADGTFWVADSDNGRVTILSPAGKRVRLVTFGAPLLRVLPLAGGDFLARVAGPDRFLGRYDTNGAKLGELPMPDGVGVLPGKSAGSMVATPTFGLIPSGGAVVGFYYLSKLVLLDAGGSVRKVVETIEPLPVPVPISADVRVKGEVWHGFRVDRSTPIAALTIAADSARAYVRYGGTSSARRLLVDTYDVRSGAYVGSSLLPEPTHQFAMADGVLYALVEDPEPAIRAWRWVPAKPAGAR